MDTIMIRDLFFQRMKEATKKNLYAQQHAAAPLRITLSFDIMQLKRGVGYE